MTSIGDGAFYECSSLKTIIIPESVTNIGDYAFYGCSDLTTIKIPEGLSGIGRSTFYNCSSLTSINIPESVTSIGDYAFRGCSSLETITIPEGLASIGNFAFCLCSSLTNVYCLTEEVPEIELNAFKGTPIEVATLYVPEGSVDVYKTTSPWSSFGTIIGLTQDMIDGIKDLKDSKDFRNFKDFKDTWYSLDGHKMGSKPTKQGIYIVGGRKVLIK